ncbi:hypothetical protein ATK36_3199 [Amycolatopsis sulphurea]|uniref:Uncharacterized protein n=2 Tax=Amycolatopsis sulphurea TaxID=76022 RepID=A0A2A9FCH7_9PSEU|nr:hypothetical protein ATK36_3199 [Amycolatopsis sulphurea]
MEGSDAGTAAARDDRADDEHHDPDRLSAYRKIFATRARKDGSRHVADLTADELEILQWDAEYFEQLAGYGTWDPKGLAELNAARALLRSLAKVTAPADRAPLAS